MFWVLTRLREHDSSKRTYPKYSNHYYLDRELAWDTGTDWWQDSVIILIKWCCWTLFYNINNVKAVSIHKTKRRTSVPTDLIKTVILSIRQICSDILILHILQRTHHRRRRDDNWCFKIKLNILCHKRVLFIFRFWCKFRNQASILHCVFEEDKLPGSNL